MIEIVEKTWGAIGEYERVPMAFSGHSFLDPRELMLGRFVEIPCAPFEKDYDKLAPPAALARENPVDQWVMLLARKLDKVVGGLLLAFGRGSYDAGFLGESDACVVDIRVATPGRGVGSAMIEAASKIAQARHMKCIKAETQNNNVAACRFYRAVGFEIESVTEGVYAGFPDEARVIWRKALLPIQ